MVVQSKDLPETRTVLFIVGPYSLVHLLITFWVFGAFFTLKISLSILLLRSGTLYGNPCSTSEDIRLRRFLTSLE